MAWQKKKGPFLVTERINDVIYRIKRSPRAKPKVVHHDRLKLYIGEQTFSLTQISKCQGLKKKQTNKRTNKYTKETQIAENFGMVEIAFSKIYLYMSSYMHV